MDVLASNPRVHSVPVYSWPARAAVWLEWVVLTTVGWIAGSLLVFAALAWTTGVADLLVHSVGGSAILGALFGVAVGGCQLFVLRRLPIRTAVWLAATTGLWAVAWALGQTLANLLFDSYSLLAFIPAGLLAAAIVSIGQWASLRRYAHRASAWLACSMLGWTAAAVVCMYGGGGLLGAGLASVLGPAAWLVALAPGAFAGAVTGIALLALL
jgi:uncharacterized integral membrane protein